VVLAARFLMILITLRMLMPAGICACQAASPAGRMLAALFDTNVPPSAPSDDDHNPGCPASIFSTGMGVFPAPVPQLHLLPSLPPAPVLLAELPLPESSLHELAGFAPLLSLAAGLHLPSLCALIL
jgi:hypothetical protein